MVCSRHFRKEDMFVDRWGFPNIKPYANPSQNICNPSSNLQKRNKIPLRKTALTPLTRRPPTNALSSKSQNILTPPNYFLSCQKQLKSIAAKAADQASQIVRLVQSARNNNSSAERISMRISKGRSQARLQSSRMRGGGEAKRRIRTKYFKKEITINRKKEIKEKSSEKSVVIANCVKSIFKKSPEVLSSQPRKVQYLDQSVTKRNVMGIQDTKNILYTFTFEELIAFISKVQRDINNSGTTLNQYLSFISKAADLIQPKNLNTSTKHPKIKPNRGSTHNIAW